MDCYQTFIHKSRYARWNYDKERRETWEETVSRYVNYIKNHMKESLGHSLSNFDEEILFTSIHDMEVMPSMRAMMSAGEALNRDNVAAFNCSYLEVREVRSFSDTMYILMAGTGVGYSVESRCVSQLPTVYRQIISKNKYVIEVQDSRIGWAEAFRDLLECLYAGIIPYIDYTLVRPKGKILKTFGGRSSGPKPLKELFEFTKNIFKGALGRKLDSLECHDIMCKIASVIVAGGVRRSALISLFDKDDEKMLKCKTGSWWENNPQRALANNSMVFEEKPTSGEFLNIWTNIYNSHSGEPGIFNRCSVEKHMENIGRSVSGKIGTNPCCEISLRDKQFCNLTEVVIKPDDELIDVVLKVGVATFIGLIQSTLTNFRYLDDEWKNNCEEERLLGVSLTGIYDNQLFFAPMEVSKVLEECKKMAKETHDFWISRLGLNESKAITCIKPSGTVSQLVNSSSGIHPRYSEYYLKRVRMSVNDPIRTFLVDEGIHNEPCVNDPENTIIFTFSVKSPNGAMLRKDLNTLNHLALWKVYNIKYADHQVSCTINIRDNEWIDVAHWVFNNFNEISGLSFYLIMRKIIHISNFLMKSAMKKHI